MNENHYVLGMSVSVENPVARTGFKVAALVMSKLRRTDIKDEFEHLTSMPRAAGLRIVAAVLVGLFLSALLAASFGWVGLAVYFLTVLVIFR